MAQLLLIKEASLSTADNRAVGDIVGIYPDDHVFSDHELKIFDVVQVKDVSKADIEIHVPETREVIRAKTTDWDFEENLERKPVWKTSVGDYKEVVTQPRFALRYEDGLIKNVYALYPENTATVLIATDVKDEPVIKG